MRGESVKAVKGVMRGMCRYSLSSFFVTDMIMISCFIFHITYVLFIEYVSNIGETADEKFREKEQNKILGYLDQFQK